MGLISVAFGRLSQAFLLLIAMSLIGFVGIHSIGNPVFNVVNIETATPEDIRLATIALGLDQPIWRQYLVFVGNVVSGNFGTSYIYHQPAFELVMRKLPATLELASIAILIAAPLGTALGLLAGRRSGTVFDRILLNGSVSALSIPSFWLAMMLILVGAILTGWFPSGGRGSTVRVPRIQSTQVAALNLGLPISLASPPGKSSPPSSPFLEPSLAAPSSRGDGMMRPPSNTMTPLRTRRDIR